ncbi:Fe-S protein assembly co-chaperone HscB [Psychromonas sp. CD1]|uniref:Fe-S protein assembly co-chaperone HscB n=1 Tax=Psychromonas sp. CD1 TaxID=1979839 RepID=UPI000B9BE6E1|nr:Fe-S protein assembly co-chaperone HscB [Psychromonas sp. CD1]
MNYFEIFSLVPSFSIDLVLLGNTYRNLQKQYHPDKYVMSCASKRLVAMQKSTEINDAYQTLKNNCLRAQYLLLLSGMDIELEQRTLQDTDFLIQQMLWREKVEQFRVEDEDEITDFSTMIVQQIANLENEFEMKRQQNALEESAECVRKLKFMLKLQIELDQLEEKLFD